MPRTPADWLREWPLVAVFAFILVMLLPMLHADFAMIDDHEIAAMLGRDGRVGVAELVPMARVWTIEHNGRFRPGYYVLRIAESIVAGGDPRLWHMNRLVLALASALALYVALRVFLPPVAAGVGALLFFSGPQNQIWLWLGPGEAYGVPLMLGGLAWIAVQLGRHQSGLARLFPGFAMLLLAGFMKESFIPALPATLVFIYGVTPWLFPSILGGRPRFTLVDLVATGVLIVGIGVQVWLTLEMLRAYGHQYVRETSVISFLYAVKPSLMRYSKDTLWFVPVVAALVAMTRMNERREWEQSGRSERIQVVGLLVAALVLILGPQWILYGEVTMTGRYLTPGNVFAVAAVAVGLYSLSRRGAGRGATMLRGSVLGILVLVGLFNVFRTHAQANEEVMANRKFQEGLVEVVDLKTQYPQLPLLYCSIRISDREPLVSVARFLAVKLPTPERPFLDAFDWPAAAATPLERDLAGRLRRQSLEGDKFFVRIGDFRGTGGRCIAVVFSGASPNCRCDHSVRVLGR